MHVCSEDLIRIFYWNLGSRSAAGGGYCCSPSLSHFPSWKAADTFTLSAGQATRQKIPLSSDQKEGCTTKRAPAGAGSHGNSSEDVGHPLQRPSEEEADLFQLFRAAFQETLKSSIELASGVCAKPRLHMRSKHQEKSSSLHSKPLLDFDDIRDTPLHTSALASSQKAADCRLREVWSSHPLPPPLAAAAG